MSPDEWTAMSSESESESLSRIVDGKRVVAKEERDSEALSGEREEGEKPKPTSEMSPDEWTAMPSESESESLSKGGDVVKEEDSRSEEQQEHKPEEKKEKKERPFLLHSLHRRLEMNTKRQWEKAETFFNRKEDESTRMK